MSEKQMLLGELRAELERWEALLDAIGEAGLERADLPEGLSIRDVLGHLRAWQQVSIARLEAARAGGEPALPDWLMGVDPESEADLELFNARIHEIYREQPVQTVRQLWGDGFRHLLELAAEIPEGALADAERHPWLNGYALRDVLVGTLEHHRTDHREPLQAWLRAQGDGGGRRGLGGFL